MMTLANAVWTEALPTIFLSPQAIVCGAGLSDMEEVRQVGPHETFPFVEWDVLSWRAELPAGVADKDIDRPASLAFSVHGGASGGLIGDVAG